MRKLNSTPPSPAFSAQSDIKVGFLLKRGNSIRPWKRRFVMLQPHRVRYFDPKDRRVLKGEFLLDEHYQACVSDTKPFAFELTHRSRRTYVFVADSVATRDAWIHAFNDAIEKLQLEASGSEVDVAPVSHALDLLRSDPPAEIRAGLHCVTQLVTDAVAGEHNLTRFVNQGGAQVIVSILDSTSTLPDVLCAATQVFVYMCQYAFVRDEVMSCGVVRVVSQLLQCSTMEIRCACSCLLALTSDFGCSGKYVARLCTELLQVDFMGQLHVILTKRVMPTEAKALVLAVLANTACYAQLRDSLRSTPQLITFVQSNINHSVPFQLLHYTISFLANLSSDEYFRSRLVSAEGTVEQTLGFLRCYRNADVTELILIRRVLLQMVSNFVLHPVAQKLFVELGYVPVILDMAKADDPCLEYTCTLLANLVSSPANVLTEDVARLICEGILPLLIVDPKALLLALRVLYGIVRHHASYGSVLVDAGVLQRLTTCQWPPVASVQTLVAFLVVALEPQTAAGLPEFPPVPKQIAVRQIVG